MLVIPAGIEPAAYALDVETVARDPSRNRTCGLRFRKPEDTSLKHLSRHAIASFLDGDLRQVVD